MIGSYLTLHFLYSLPSGHNLYPFGMRVTPKDKKMSNSALQRSFLVCPSPIFAAYEKKLFS